MQGDEIGYLALNLAGILDQDHAISRCHLGEERLWSRRTDLLDEPMSNLDTVFRASPRGE